MNVLGYRFSIHRLIALVLALLLLGALLASALADETQTVFVPSFTEVAGKYGAGYDQKMIYSDQFLLEDSTQGVWPEVAKIAATLAGAADEERLINNMLAQLGYNSESYNFDVQRTLEDNDIVSYTIGSKQLENSDKTAFIVAVRGTGESAEWFSTFNVGSETDHAGFAAAAKDVRASLADYIQNTAVNDRIILVTGHGRGGAVANLLAADLYENKFVPAAQLFGYTFGCPNVSKSAQKYPSIYNFNLVGDILTVFPPSDWGYGRYGTDYDIFAPGEMFEELVGREYHGAQTSQHYEDAFESLFPTADDLADENNTEERFFVMYLAYSLGGHMDVTLTELLAKYTSENWSAILKKFLFEDTLVERLDNVYQSSAAYYKTLLDLLKKMLLDTQDMTDTEFAEYCLRYREEITDVYNATGKVISDVADLSPAIALMTDAYEKAMDVAALCSLFFTQMETTDGHLLTSILDAHQIPIYVLWVNHEYYGYQGYQLEDGNIRVPENVYTVGPECFNGSGITGFSAEDLLYIPDDCFEYAASLKTLVIPNSVIRIGPAFEGCSGLKEITLPVEQSKFGIFYGCSNVESIHYTVQDDGMMPERSNFSSDGNYYSRTLEYICRESVRKIEYDEGIAEIPNYTNYHEGKGQLETVVFPSTLKRIGHYAFYGCDARTYDLPTGLETIGDYAFACSPWLGFIHIPANVVNQGDYAFGGCGALEDITFDCRVIGPRWFADCTAIEILIIPDNIVAINSGAFSNCTGLKYVMLPIEQSGFHAFDGCTNVLVIEYTAQGTGIMPARSSFSSDSNYYSRTLEYQCRQSVQKILYGEGVTKIANYANYHEGKGQLAEVSLPSTLRCIDDSAFRGTALTSVTLPESLQEIGAYAFAGSSLTSIHIPASVTVQRDYAFAWCGALKNITFGCSSIGPYWFDGCTGLQTLVIPNNITSISSGAFNNCTGLKSVTLPIEQSVFHAFEYCSNVETIQYTAQDTGVMPARSNFSSDSNYYSRTLEYQCRQSVQKLVYSEGVTKIANYANYHEGKGRLAEVSLPSTLRCIDDSAFRGTALTSITLPESLEEIGAYAFAGSSLTSIYIPASVTVQRDYAFAWCGALKNITFGCSSIGPYWFNGCTGLQTLVIPNNITFISSGAFNNCTGLKSVTLPIEQSVFHAFEYCSNVETIQYTAQDTGIMPERSNFSSDSNYYSRTLEYQCRQSIQKIVYGKGVTKIANYANYHEGKGRLAEVSLPSTLVCVDDYAFYGTALPSVTLPESLQEIGAYAFAGSSLTSIHIPASVTVQRDFAFAWCGALKNITFGCSSIGPYWFDGCTGLQTLVIPNNITSISSGAFNNCTGLKSVTLPIEQSVFHAFEYCSNVETIQYTVQDTGIMPERSAFSYDSNYYSRTLEYQCGQSVQELIFDQGVTELADYAFYESSVLAHVALPDTLQKIGSYAFFNCTALSSITMPSSLESIADYAFSQSALTVICPANSYAHTWAVSKGYTVQPICAAHAVVLAQNLYETTLGEAIDIPFTLSCAGACGMDVYWADDAQRSDTANGSISYPADACGARTIRLWLDGEQDKAVSCRVIVHAEQQMILPGDLTVLGEESFAGMAAAEILLPEGMSVIGPRAFAQCADLVLITIPDSVTLIADDAFEGSANVTILCADGSYAAEYADQMQIACIAR